jgi:hypothetical protein
MPKKETYQSLKKRLAAFESKTCSLREQVFEMKFQRELPKLKKKYLGKYFKYKNSFGTSNKGWWLYFFVKGIEDTFYAKGCSFETDIDGHSQFELNGDISFSNLIEITEEEYTKALHLFLAAAAKLTQ